MLQQLRRTRTLVPAVLAAIAYVDPGNFGVNISAGREHGYSLIWVVVLASTMACLIQYLAAKLGAASGLSLPQASAQHFGTGIRRFLWVQAELVVVMTQLAEVVGAAIALNLLFGTPLLLGAVLTGLFCFVVPMVRIRGKQGFAPIVIGLFVVIIACLGYELWLSSPDLTAALGGAVPGPMSASAALLSVGIIGATVMPHALHFHSAHAREVRDPEHSRVGALASRRLLRQHAGSVVFALAVAGGANISLMVMAVKLPPQAADGIEGAYAGLMQVGQPVAATVLGIALLASGIASTLVGVDTGQAVNEGFVTSKRMSEQLRRALGLLVPIAILATGLGASHALVLSQVVLSFALPGTLIPLVLLTQRRAVMGSLVNARVTAVLAWVCTAIIVGLDVYLVATSVI